MAQQSIYNLVSRTNLEIMAMYLSVNKTVLTEYTMHKYKNPACSDLLSCHEAAKQVSTIS